MEYPANCHYSTGDGYSGWFATRGQRQCSDFCFWDIAQDAFTPYNNDDSFTPYNTADPHETTTAPDGKSTWRCAIDVASDDITWQEVMSSKLGPAGAFGEQFSHLRCRGGAGETLSTTWMSWMSSSAFWSLAIIMCTGILALEACLFAHRRRRLLRSGDTATCEDGRGDGEEDACTMPLNTSRLSGQQSVEEDQVEISSMAAPTNTCEDTNNSRKAMDERDQQLRAIDAPIVQLLHSEAGVSTRNYGSDLPKEGSGQFIQFQHRLMALCAPPCRRRVKKWLAVASFVLLNLVLPFTIFIAITSLVEISGVYTATFTLKKFTPACTDPSTVCDRGNRNVDRSSSEPPLTFLPFSYLIASDVQLDWYAGESAYIGRRSYPPACHEQMSCKECTMATAKYTNDKMKFSMEKLISDTSDPHRPKTLVINGDLTAYFHRGERNKYEALYHNVDGLENFFPSLGNHEYDHGDATYDGDQWFGPPSCNAAHSVGYLKSGFCGKIPTFDVDRIVRYDAESLAYSWEEGRYHFVHLHYYPTYENTRIGVKSSMAWLEQDLERAHEVGLTTVIFSHAAGGIEQNKVLERVLLGRGVAAIFAGHDHRCLHRKCVGLSTLDTGDVEDPQILATAEKCLPASVAMCGGNADGNDMSLFYLKDVDPGIELPERTLFVRSDSSLKPLCPKRNSTYINEIDQTLLCREAVISPPDFPSTQNIVSGNETIPLFWSGSASFEVFLRADFHEDRIVVNALTAEEGLEGQRYLDAHHVPNAVYPHHNKSDLETVTIYV